MAQKKSYKGKKQYGMYATELRFAKNKLRKLLKHLKKHPDDAIAVTASAVKLDTPTRKRPITRPWKSVSDQVLAKIASETRGMMRAESYLINTKEPGLVRGIDPLKAMAVKNSRVKAAYDEKIAA